MITLAVALVALVVLGAVARHARPRWVPPVAFGVGVAFGAGTLLLGSALGLVGYAVLVPPVLGVVALGLGLQRFVAGRAPGAWGAGYAVVGVVGGFVGVFLYVVATCGGCLS